MIFVIACVNFEVLFYVFFSIIAAKIGSNHPEATL